MGEGGLGWGGGNGQLIIVQEINVSWRWSTKQPSVTKPTADRMSDCFSSCLVLGFHSNLLSGCLALGPSELLWLRWETLFWFVWTLLRINQAAYPGFGGDVTGDDIISVAEVRRVGQEPGRLGQHMAPQVSTTPIVIPELLPCSS